MDYTKKLNALLPDASPLEKVVIQDAIDAESAESYLSDVMQHGCQSGIVSGLIYFTDTKAFYIEHIDDIEELKNEMEDSLGQPLEIGTPMYNWLAWFGYEEAARKVAEKIGMEV